MGRLDLENGLIVFEFPNYQFPDPCFLKLQVVVSRL